MENDHVPLVALTADPEQLPAPPVNGEASWGNDDLPEALPSQEEPVEVAVNKLAIAAALPPAPVAGKTLSAVTGDAMTLKHATAAPVPPSTPTGDEGGLRVTASSGRVEESESGAIIYREPTKIITPDITFAIPTMRRRARDGSVAPVKYLTPLVEGILSDLTEDQKVHVKVFLYNVDREPDEHTEVAYLVRQFPNLVMAANKPKRDYFDAENQDDIVQLEKSDGHVLEMSMDFFNWISGETNDAANLLFEAHKLSPYVVFLEDDVKPTSGVMSKLSDYLAEMETRNLDSWFMVDLYTPKIDWGRNPLYVKNFEPYDYECCTQAMLFRSDRLMDLLMYETSHPNMPIDDNIRDFAREDPSNREVYAIIPNLFEHVGMYSSNPEKTRDRVEHESIHFVP